MPSLIINEAKALNDNVTTVYTHAIMKSNFLDSRSRLNSYFQEHLSLALYQLSSTFPRASCSEGILFRGHLVLSVKKYLTMKCISQDGLGCWYTLRKMFSQRDTADQADQFDESGYVDELFSKRGLKILHQNIRGLIANKNKY